MNRIFLTFLSILIVFFGVFLYMNRAQNTYISNVKPKVDTLNKDVGIINDSLKQISNMANELKDSFEVVKDSKTIVDISSVGENYVYDNREIGFKLVLPKTMFMDVKEKNKIISFGDKDNFFLNVNSNNSKANSNIFIVVEKHTDLNICMNMITDEFKEQKINDLNFLFLNTAKDNGIYVLNAKDHCFVFRHTVNKINEEDAIDLKNELKDFPLNILKLMSWN